MKLRKCFAFWKSRHIPFGLVTAGQTKSQNILVFPVLESRYVSMARLMHATPSLSPAAPSMTCPTVSTTIPYFIHDFLSLLPLNCHT